METDPIACFRRRLARDVTERGRTPESVREPYERTVRPDLTVSGEEPLAHSTAAVVKVLERTKSLSYSTGA